MNISLITPELNSEKDKFAIPISLLPSSTISTNTTLSLNTKPLSLDTSYHGTRYSDEICHLICQFAAKGISTRTIPEILQDVMKYSHQTDEICVPSFSCVKLILKEKYLFDKLTIIKQLSEIEKPILGIDTSPSRGRTLLALNALSSGSSLMLGTSEIVYHDAGNLAKTIVEILTNLHDLAKRFPETMEFAPSASIQSFCGLMSDYMNVNSAIVRNLEKDHHIELYDLKCSAHKSDLIENAVHSVIKENRTLNRMIDGEEEDQQPSLAMKAPKSKKSYDCSFSFLWVLTNTLSLTGKNKYGMATTFSSWLKLQQTHITLLPIQGSRFHIYSINAICLYQNLPFFSAFINTLNSDTWTAKFLKAGLNSPQTKHELRILSLFAYGFSIPLLYTFETYTVKQASELWNTAKRMIDNWEHPKTQNHTLWEFIQQQEVDEKNRAKMVKKLESKTKQIEAVLNDWTDNDTIIWRKAMIAAKKELLVIAKEYLPNGSLTTIPPHLQNMPGHNLHLESHFALWKYLDTHANHYAVASIEGRTNMRNKRNIELSTESKQKIRRIVEEEWTTQQQLDYKYGVQRENKREYENQEKKAANERKRKRESELEEALSGVAIETDRTKLWNMPNEDLRLQLMLWKRKGKKVQIGVSKKDRFLQLCKFLKE